MYYVLHTVYNCSYIHVVNCTYSTCCKVHTVHLYLPYKLYIIPYTVHTVQYILHIPYIVYIPYILHILYILYTCKCVHAV